MRTSELKIRCRSLDFSVTEELRLLNLTDKVQPLSLAAEIVHQDVLQEIEDKTGIYMPERVVFARSMPQLGYTLPGSPIIFVNSSIADITDKVGVEYIEGKDENLGTFRFIELHNKKQDKLRSTLIHEYCHVHFNDCYSASVVQALRHNLNPQRVSAQEISKIIRSIDEAFAYFFQESITGVDVNITDVALEYDNCICSVILDIFDRLKQNTNSQNLREISTNIVSIVNDYLSSRVCEGVLTKDKRDEFALFMRNLSKEKYF